MATGTYDGGDIGAPGAGTRMAWYPQRAGFRAGTASADAWDSSNMGLYSFAFGYDAMATNNYAVAFGLNGKAEGASSVVGGGSGNEVSGSYGTIGGGSDNGLSQNYGTIGGDFRM